MSTGRYRKVERERLGPEEQAVYDRIAGPRGFLPTPHEIMMQHPSLAELLGLIGERLRFHGVLPGDVRELAILTVGRETGAPYEWVSHEPIARREGVRDEAIQAVLTGAEPAGLTEREALTISAVRSLLHERQLPDALFDAAQAAFGAAGLAELVVLAGYYATLASILRVYHAPLPDGAEAPF